MFLLLMTASSVDAYNYGSGNYYKYNKNYGYNSQYGQQQQQEQQQSYGQLQSINCISFRVEPVAANSNGGAPAVETFGLPYVNEESFMFLQYSGDDSFDSSASWMIDLEEWAEAFASLSTANGGSGYDAAEDDELLSTMSGCQAIENSFEVLEGVLDGLLQAYKESLKDNEELFQVNEGGRAFANEQERESYIQEYLEEYATSGIQLYWGPICKRSSWGVTQGVFLDESCTVYVPYMQAKVEDYISKGLDEDLIAYNTMAKTVLNSAYSQPVSCNNNGGQFNGFCATVIGKSVNIDTCESMDSNSENGAYSDNGGAAGGSYGGAYGEAEDGSQGEQAAYDVQTYYHISQNDLADPASTCYAVENALVGGMPSMWDQLGMLETEYEQANASRSSGLSAAVIVGIAAGALALLIGIALASCVKVRLVRRNNAVPSRAKEDATINDDDSDTSKKEPLVARDTTEEPKKRENKNGSEGVDSEWQL